MYVELKNADLSTDDIDFYLNKKTSEDELTEEEKLTIRENNIDAEEENEGYDMEGEQDMEEVIEDNFNNEIFN